MTAENGILARLVHLEGSVRDLWHRHDKVQESSERLAVVESQVGALAEEVRALRRAAWGFAASFLLSTLAVAITIVLTTTSH